jgi:cell division protein FtsB
VILVIILLFILLLLWLGPKIVHAFRLMLRQVAEILFGARAQRNPKGTG